MCLYNFFSSHIFLRVLFSNVITRSKRDARRQTLHTRRKVVFFFVVLWWQKRTYMLRSPWVGNVSCQRRVTFIWLAREQNVEMVYVLYGWPARTIYKRKNGEKLWNTRMKRNCPACFWSGNPPANVIVIPLAVVNNNAHGVFFICLPRSELEQVSSLFVFLFSASTCRLMFVTRLIFALYFILFIARKCV